MTLTRIFRWSTWTPFERLWLALFILAGTVVTVREQDSLLNYGILLTGIFCVVLAAKGHILTYAFGLFNSLGYAYVSYRNGLYGDMALNLLFFVPTNILGFFLWRAHPGDNGVAMRALRRGPWLAVILACLLAVPALGYGLSLIRTQNTPYLDAASTVLSIVATLLMMGRYKEQWLLYIVLNVVTIAMWAMRLLQGSSDGSMMIVMWTAFLVNAVYGYLNWSKGAASRAAGGAAA